MTGALAPDSDKGVDERLDAVVDWRQVVEDLNRFGAAGVEGLLWPGECRRLGALYGNDELFRNRVVMERHGFGRGEYKYFDYPLPGLVAALREQLYPPLAAVANQWHEALGVDERYPARHKDYIQQCLEAGQARPTPLMLYYEADDYNCLHQDLYGSEMFPLQVAIQLSKPGRDFTGGEFVLTEQRPRRQSRVEVVPLQQGDAVVFAVHRRPVTGKRGPYRVMMRHGVSRVRSGRRCTLGIIFHDAG